MPRAVSAMNKSPKGSTATFHGESSVSSGPTTCMASVATFKSYTALHGSGLQYDSSATYRFWPAASTEIPRGDTAPPDEKVVRWWLPDCYSGRYLMFGLNPPINTSPAASSETSNGV